MLPSAPLRRPLCRPRRQARTVTNFLRETFSNGPIRYCQCRTKRRFSAVGDVSQAIPRCLTSQRHNSHYFLVFRLYLSVRHNSSLAFFFIIHCFSAQVIGFACDRVRRFQYEYKSRGLASVKSLNESPCNMRVARPGRVCRKLQGLLYLS